MKAFRRAGFYLEVIDLTEYKYRPHFSDFHERFLGRDICGRWHKVCMTPTAYIQYVLYVQYIYVCIHTYRLQNKII